MGKKSDRRAQRIADAIARNGGVDLKPKGEVQARHRQPPDTDLMLNPGLAVAAMSAMMMSMKPAKKPTVDPESPSEPEKE